MKRTWRWLMVGLGLSLTACQKPGQVSSGKPLVVTSATMVTDMAKQIGGDRVEVRGLMGPGVDPHTYTPRAGDSALLEKAKVVLYSGLHLEGQMTESLEAMAKRGRVAVAITSGIPENELLAPQEGFSGTHDPHVWGDPALWLKTIDPVVKALSQADPEGAAIYQERGAKYRAELAALSEWAKRRTAEIPAGKRVLVTSHDAFFYLGRAYGLEVRGLQGVSTEAEAGLKDRENLVKYLREKGIRTVFPETSVNMKGIAAVASEAGVEVSKHELFSDAMGTPGEMEEIGGEKYDKGTYAGMVKHNINTIVEGLK